MLKFIETRSKLAEALETERQFNNHEEVADYVKHVFDDVVAVHFYKNEHDQLVFNIPDWKLSKAEWVAVEMIYGRKFVIGLIETT